MKNLRNKSLIQKLIISLLCAIILINFCMTSRVQAGLGGKMMEYIVDFSTALSDVVATLVQLGVTGEWHWPVEKGAGTSATR